MKKNKLVDSPMYVEFTSEKLADYLELFPKERHEEVKRLFNEDYELRKNGAKRSSAYLQNLIHRCTALEKKGLLFKLKHNHANLPWANSQHIYHIDHEILGPIDILYRGEQVTTPMTGNPYSGMMKIVPGGGINIIFHKGLPTGAWVMLNLEWYRSIAYQGIQSQKVSAVFIPEHIVKEPNIQIQSLDQSLEEFTWIVLEENSKLNICVTNQSTGQYADFFVGQRNFLQIEWL